MTDPLVRVLPDAGALAEAVALTLADSARQSIAARGTFTIALSGGSTPRPAYELLANAGNVDWARVEVFFGDERCVPPDDPRSNYALARDALLSRVPLASHRVHPMYGGKESPADAAARYEDLLRARFPATGATFDLLFLGVGPDGHTASLFPGDAALAETSRWVLHVRAPSSFDVPDRVTLTLPALNRSRRVLFMVSGAAKRNVVSRVLDTHDTTMPAALVCGLEATEWLLDAATAP